ncbi:MAG: carboxypeptidase-like regulatory domain-containing protein [Candidatus Cyclobacteriaceae bacterium M3_2C_046]
MRLLGLTIFFVLLLLDASAQVLNGYIIDINTGQGIEGAHIINLQKRAGTSSGSDGFFSLQGQVNEILQITMVGYQPEFLIIQDSLWQTTIHISLRDSSRRLKEIEVRAPLPEPVVVKPEEPTIKMVPMGYQGPPKPVYPMSFHFDHPNKNTVKEGMVPGFGPGGTLYGVFTYLFSAKEREKKRVAKIKNNQDHFSNYQVLLYEKMPDWLIRQAVDIEKEAMSDFRHYLQFERDFLIRANDYHKIAAIQKAYKDYKNEEANAE